MNATPNVVRPVMTAMATTSGMFDPSGGEITHYIIFVKFSNLFPCLTSIDGQMPCATQSMKRTAQRAGLTVNIQSHLLISSFGLKVLFFLFVFFFAHKIPWLQ